MKRKSPSSRPSGWTTPTTSVTRWEDRRREGRDHQDRFHRGPAQQPPEVLAVLMQAADDASATVVLPEVDYELLARGLSVGGQVVTIRVADHVYEEVFLSLHGRHQADNAALAVAAIFALLGRLPSPEIVAEALGAVHSRAGSR